MTMRFLPLTAVSLLVPLLAQAAGIQVVIDGKVLTFIDVPQSAWYAADVRSAAEAGIVNGYKDTRGRLTGKFGPSNDVTLAEALKIAIEGAGYDVDAYSSVLESGAGSHWASPYVSVARAEEFAIFSSDRFRLVTLDHPATRAEVASIFASAFRVNMENLSEDDRYSDVSASTKYEAAIRALTRDSVVSGDTREDGEVTGTFRPTSTVNRAETVKIVMQSRETYDYPGEGRGPSETPAANEEATVRYTTAGFSPMVLRVKVGTTVMFRNDTADGMWVASNSHPTHTGLLGFDAERSFNQGSLYMFTFNRIGTWAFHNHLHPSDTGTVIVEE